MMRQRKISLSLLLACLLVLCCVPAAFAATDTPIDLSKIDQNISGTGWEWNFSNRCLTLTGLNLKNTDKTKVAAVILPADSVIVLAEGTKNVIETAGNNGLWCEGDLTIKGMGQLEIVRHDSSGDNLQNIVKEYDSAGILSETEGDLIIQSGTISIKNFENGIYFTSMGSYTQKGGYVSIQSREDLKSKGILASFGTVWIQNGKLHISANDFGVCCLGFLMDNGQVEINHLGERETGRAGVYVGSSVENKYYYYREEGLVAGVFLENGTLKTNGWINGVFVCDSGQYRQRGGFVKTTENTQYGICVLGGKQIQGSFQIMGGSVLAEGDVSAVLAIIPHDVSKSIQYIQLENVVSMTNDSKYFLDYNQVEGDLIGVAGFVPENVNIGANHASLDYETLLLDPNNHFLKTFQVQCGSDMTTKPSVALYINGLPFVAHSENESIYVDNNGRTMAPLRVLAEAMEFVVNWNAADQSITIQNGTQGTVVFYLGKAEYLVNGKACSMDTTAVSLPPGRVHVPLRYVAESLGAQVRATKTADGLRIDIAC